MPSRIIRPVAAVDAPGWLRMRRAGEFVWHHRGEEDELFLVINGTLLMRLRDWDMTIHEGQFFIVPRGIEHQPVAQEECQFSFLSWPAR
ncbi:MAG TPA: cupin domain-containing protein [Bacteroidota bacterium]|nr:cupin domain-containing protein [Bacteroidota bacterium]